MPRQIKEIDPDWIATAIKNYSYRHKLDIDLTTLNIEGSDEPGKSKFKFTAAIGKYRTAITTQVDGKRTVIGWGDTEAEAWKMAKEHHRWGGHPYNWTIDEDTFDKIAAGDFDASSWSPAK